MSKVLELAKKLKALAEQGVGGEKENAQAMLDALLIKHNITLEQLEEEKRDVFFIKMPEVDFRLFSQIAKNIRYDIDLRGEFTKAKIKKLKLPGNFAVICTASEYIELEAKHDFYSKLYKKELSVFFVAFCTANNLLTTPPKLQSYEDLTPEEKEHYLRIQNMSAKIKREAFHKQLKQHD